MLAGTGLPLVVVTNQGGIAQGIATHALVEAVNDRLHKDDGIGVRVAAVYYSPNRELKGGPAGVYNAPHAWRKPNPGMLVAAAEELDIDLSRSWMVGDRGAIEAGLDPKRCLRRLPESLICLLRPRRSWPVTLITTSCESRLL